MSFINWGPESFEQREQRRKLEEQALLYQVMAKKMFEQRAAAPAAPAAATAAAASAGAAGGGANETTQPEPPAPPTPPAYYYYYGGTGDIPVDISIPGTITINYTLNGGPTNKFTIRWKHDRNTENDYSIYARDAEGNDIILAIPGSKNINRTVSLLNDGSQQSPITLTATSFNYISELEIYGEDSTFPVGIGEAVNINSFNFSGTPSRLTNVMLKSLEFEDLPTALYMSTSMRALGIYGCPNFTGFTHGVDCPLLRNVAFLVIVNNQYHNCNMSSNSINELLVFMGSNTTKNNGTLTIITGRQATLSNDAINAIAALVIRGWYIQVN